MNKRIVRKHGGKSASIFHFKRCRTLISEYFDEFIIIVKHNEEYGGKKQPVLEWGFSDANWARGAMFKIGSILDE